MKPFSNISTSQNNFKERYSLKSQIGSGLTSIVSIVFDNQTGQTKVAKIYESNAIETFQKEIKMHKYLEELNLPSIIKLYDYGVDDITLNGQTKERMYAILEYGSHGTLYDAVEKTRDGFTEDVCQYILLNILNAIEALHKKGICHRDLKPENLVFVGDNYELKLIDFGFSAKFINKENAKIKLKKSVGTVYYCPPEILQNKLYDGEKADIFCIGALLFILMTRKFAFEEAKVINTSMKIKKILYKLIKAKQYDKYWQLLETSFNIKILSQNFKNLFVKLVAYEPEERPSIDEIRKDAWMSDIANANEEKLEFLHKKMIDEITMS